MVGIISDKAKVSIDDARAMIEVTGVSSKKATGSSQLFDSGLLFDSGIYFDSEWGTGDVTQGEKAQISISRDYA